MDAVDGQEAGHLGAECGRDGHPNGVGRHHLLSEDLLREDGLHPAHAVGPDLDLHSDGLADELADGAQLVGVEVDCHEEEHLPERGGDAGLLLEGVLLADEPAQPVDGALLQARGGDEGVASEEDAQAEGDELDSGWSGRGRVGRDQIKKKLDFILRKPNQKRNFGTFYSKIFSDPLTSFPRFL